MNSIIIIYIFRIEKGGRYRRPCQINDIEWFIKNKSTELSIVQV